MDFEEAMDRDCFIVECQGIFASVMLRRGSAGWSVHVMKADFENGSTVYFGHGAGPFPAKEDARQSGVDIATEKLSQFVTQGPGHVAFVLTAVAIEGPEGSGNFDAAIRVKNANGEITDVHLIQRLGGGTASREEALEIARIGLQHVDGLTEQGKVFV